MGGSIVGGEGGWFVTIFDKLVGEGKMASGLAACAFFAEIGRIAGDVEDHVAVMILDCGIGVGCRVV